MPLEHCISTEQLASLVGTGECPTLVDLRIDEDFEADPTLLPTSFRQDFRDVGTWSGQLPDRPVVVICHKGLKISQGVSALLRCQGHSAAHLTGGKVAWADERRPTVPAHRMPPGLAEEPSRWVTSFDPGIGAIAAGWLIRRFIDTRAQLLFVDPDQVSAVADRLGATALAASDGHDDHRGFGGLLKAFTLSSPELDYVALAIAGARGNHGPVIPESAGIVAAIEGVVASYQTDLEIIEAGLPVFDAFYAWCRASGRKA